MPNGDVVAGGAFTTAGGVSANQVARWNGSAWSAIGAGTDGPVYAVAASPNGYLVASGSFTFGDNQVSPYVATLTTTCLASATSGGGGCSGVAGPNVVVATSLPWIGSAGTAIASGMPINSLAVGVLGLSPVAIPLAAILPQGAPGCPLLASPDLLTLHLTGAGSFATSLAIPATVALANTGLHHQVIALELSSSGGITALTGTKARELTIGSF